MNTTASPDTRSPSYEACLLIIQSVCAALDRAGVDDCDDPGEAIDVMREGYERRLTAPQPPAEAQSCPECHGTGGHLWHEADGSERGDKCGTCDGFGHVYPAEAQAQGGGERKGCGDPECGCDTPSFTEPLEALRFLSGRFKYAGVSHGVAEAYARDIDAILARHDTAPPSAPVGVEELARSMFEDQADEHATPWERQWYGTQKYWRKKARDILAQQPAAVDRRHTYVQSKDHGGCANCGYPEWEPWHALAAQPGGSDND